MLKTEGYSWYKPCFGTKLGKGVYLEALGGKAKVEDEVKNLVVQGAVQSNAVNACNQTRFTICIS